MKKHYLPLCLAALTFVACKKDNLSGSLDHQNEVRQGDVLNRTEDLQEVIQGEYIVRLKSNALQGLDLPNQSYEAKLRSAHAQITQLLRVLPQSKSIEIQRLYVNVLSGFSANFTEIQIAQLKRLDFVESVDQNVRVTLKDFDQKETSSPVQKSGTQVAQYGVIRTGYADGTGKRAFVLDSGIDLDHDDLNVNTALGKDFTTDGGFFGGGGGLFGGGSSGPEGEDDNGHGTHCAGIIAAIDNNIGVVGVAANAEVVAVKVIDWLGRANGDDVIQGLDYISSVGQPGDVVNMSLGFIAGYTPVDNATLNLAAQGIFVAAAAMNDSRNANTPSPARANGPNLYTISAMDINDDFASFSNFGNPPIDFCAPGVDILSTHLNNNYRELSGTSMATPHVAGILLINNGVINSDGVVNLDPDGIPDSIAVL